MSLLSDLRQRAAAHRERRHFRSIRKGLGPSTVRTYTRWSHR